MTQVEVSVVWKGSTLKVNLSAGHCIAIPLDDTKPQPNAFFAPLYEATPHAVEGWVGDTRKGAAVNFFDIRINPHGNGTHTECMGHISKERYAVHETLGNGFFVAQLISVYPSVRADGDRIIDQLDWEKGVDAIILRTLPNHPDKKTRQYGHTNPPYLDAALAKRMAEDNIHHLLLDLPSVDREEDGGKLAAHKAFWQFDGKQRLNATITEMIFVDEFIADGLYLLQIQIPALMLDASPSRPYIYPLL
jgi:kynurenine formamidase